MGAFSANLNFSTPVVWSNMSSITSVNRAQGVTVTWTGGAANTFVNIAGGSSSSSAGLTVSFTCVAPVAAGTFTVPSYILLALPAGSGNLGVAGETAIQTFAATGLDYGYLFGSSGGMNNSISYN